MARDEFVHYENHTYYFDKKGHMQDDEDIFQKKDETYYINDFKFTGTGSKRRENEALAEEMMFYHQRYHIRGKSLCYARFDTCLHKGDKLNTPGCAYRSGYQGCCYRIACAGV